MPEIDHDWDKIMSIHKNKYVWFDRIVITFILVILTICTSLLFISLFKPDIFLCN